MSEEQVATVGDEEEIVLRIELKLDKMNLGDLGVIDGLRKGHFYEFSKFAERALVVNGKPGIEHLPPDPMLFDKIGAEIIRQLSSSVKN